MNSVTPIVFPAPAWSVVIPTCDRNESLAACLRQLAPHRQTVQVNSYEVIVTDDGAHPGAEAVVGRDFPWAQWTRGPRRGPAANRNHGASLARGGWLAFTDDDCLPDREWLAAYLSAAERAPEMCVLEGRTYPPGPRTHPLDECPINEFGGNLWSCNLAMKRDVFNRLGGFDVRFPHATMEDIELNARLAALGIRPHFVRSAAVQHPWRRIGDWGLHYRRQLSARIFLEALHPGWGFPASPPRALWQMARTIARDHLPFMLRRPLEACRVLPAMWRTMGLDVWYACRRPKATSVETPSDLR